MAQKSITTAPSEMRMRRNGRWTRVRDWWALSATVSNVAAPRQEVKRARGQAEGCGTLKEFSAIHCDDLSNRCCERFVCQLDASDVSMPCGVDVGQIVLSPENELSGDVVELVEPIDNHAIAIVAIQR